MNAGGVLNTCKSNEASSSVEGSSLLRTDTPEDDLVADG